MAINFNNNSVFKLKQISVEAVIKEVTGLLIDGEEVVMAFKTVRDQLVFTNKRIISIDAQGITGKKNHLVQCHIPKYSILLFKRPVFLRVGQTLN